MPYSCPSASNSLRAESFIFVRLRLQSHTVVFCPPATPPPPHTPPDRIISPSPPFFFSSKFQPLPSLNLFHLLKSLAASLPFVETSQHGHRGVWVMSSAKTSTESRVEGAGRAGRGPGSAGGDSVLLGRGGLKRKVW